MMVLRGEMSQWKRSRCESRAMGPAVGVAGADAGNGVEVIADEFDVGFGPEGAEAGGIEVDAGVEILLLEAEDDDGGVDELLALDAGNDAEDGVIKGGGCGHGGPPVRRFPRRQDGG